MCGFVTVHNGQRWYHDASRRCQKLSDVSDRIPCQMASDTSILSTTPPLCSEWYFKSDQPCLINFADNTDARYWCNDTSRIREWWLDRNHHQPPLLERQECLKSLETRSGGKARERERELCWPLVIVEWLRRSSQIPRTLLAPLYLWRQTNK